MEYAICRIDGPQSFVGCVKLYPGGNFRYRMVGFGWLWDLNVGKMLVDFQLALCSQGKSFCSYVVFGRACLKLHCWAVKPFCSCSFWDNILGRGVQKRLEHTLFMQSL